MGWHRRHGSRDGNEGDLVDFLEDGGCYVQRVDGIGFDLLVISPRGTIHLLEVKNPLVRKSDQKPTELETRLQQEMEKRGAVYSIVFTRADCAAAVGIPLVEQPSIFPLPGKLIA